MTLAPRRYPLDGLTDRRNRLVIVVIVIVAAAPWVGEQPAAAALGLLTAALPLTGPARPRRAA
ncbi:hypothetical protein OG379_09285 [Streptomyces sp. NBC_01166]|uniref:hypothetical protein n=1 Tax=Streptomyces sp. NBC_01166 TaxID=2903755 RepID=UPI0038660207|nr:hypothetical protein OG379_09285 [Streptomyces sp. NBC_01166]